MRLMVELSVRHLQRTENVFEFEILFVILALY